MNRPLWSRPIAISAVLMLVVVQTATATHWEPGYQNYGRGGTSYCRVSGDRFASFAYVRWTATQANNLRATGTGYGNGQLRYTQDMRDANNHVDADGYWLSDFPNPVFDSEDDSFLGESKREEAEITATSASFPTADYLYSFTARYSHWSDASSCGPTGDNNNGSIGHNEHMSWKQFPWSEWDTYNFAYSGTKYVSYPYVCVESPCSGFAPAGDEPPLVVADAAPAVDLSSRQSAAELRAPAGAPFRVIRDATGTFVDPDLSEGLDAYRSTMHVLGRRLVTQRGGIPAVLTFTRPLTPGDLADLVHLGITIEAIEAIGLDSSGQRSSAGAPYAANAWDELSVFALEASGAVLEGVVSAQVSVANAQAFNALVGDARVYLVDSSSAMAKDSAALARAPKVNDVYWYLVGWEPVQ